MSDLPILWHIEISHYSEKARWALDYKGIEHIRQAPMPGAHGLYAMRLTHGRSRTFPVLQMDGRTIGDSTAIIAALEERQPEPALYPADPAERARALELEDFFDTEVGPEVRRLAFAHLLTDREKTVGGLEQSRSGRQRTMRRIYPVMRRAIAVNYGVSAKRTAEAERKVDDAFARIEAEVGPSGYLVGDRFSVADLTAAALVGPLTAPPQYPNAVRDIPASLEEIRAAARACPGGQWALDIYERHRGASVAIAA